MTSAQGMPHMSSSLPKHTPSAALSYLKPKFNQASLFSFAKSGNSEQVVLKEWDMWTCKELWDSQTQRLRGRHQAGEFCSLPWHPKSTPSLCMEKVQDKCHLD